MNKRTIEMVMHNPPALSRTFEEDIKKELCNNYAFADKNGFYCTACKKYHKKQTGRLVDNEYNHKIELVAERKHRDVRMCPFCYKQVKKYDAWRGRKTLEQSAKKSTSTVDENLINLKVQFDNLQTTIVKIENLIALVADEQVRRKLAIAIANLLSRKSNLIQKNAEAE